MNINVAELLNGNYILLLFVVLALGLCLGKLRLGSIQLGNSIGVLVVSLLLGQQHFSINTDALNLGFMLFIFCVGVEAGPNFFSIFFGGSLDFTTDLSGKLVKSDDFHIQI